MNGDELGLIVTPSPVHGTQIFLSDLKSYLVVGDMDHFMATEMGQALIFIHVYIYIYVHTTQFTICICIYIYIVLIYIYILCIGTYIYICLVNLLFLSCF